MMTSYKPPVTPLRPDQREPATAPAGPVLILGGAGAGATHTIAARIAVLLKNGAGLLQIACLTHSARGGDDIRQRVLRFLPDEGPVLGIFAGTPQQLALKLLRRKGMESLGRSADFTLWQRDDARAVLAELLAANGRARRRVDAEAGRVLDWRRLNRAGFPGESIPPDSPDWPGIVVTYQAEKQRQNVVDHDDLIALVTLALERDRAFREGVAWSECRHLLIDGLQDLAPAEYGMARLLTGPERSITVAANPNACVRTGDGAGHRVLEAFRTDFPEPGRRTYQLSLNLRSTAAIGEAVHRMSHDPAMAHLIGEQHRYIRTNRPVGATFAPMAPPALLVFEGRPADMYRYIFDRTGEFVEQGHALEDIACIYMDASILDHLRVLAVSRGLPYTVLGGEPRVWDRDARRITGLLASLLNPRDFAAFRIAACLDPRIEPPWLDPVVAVRIAGMAADLGIDLVQAAGRYCRNPLIDAGLRRGLECFVEAWQNLDRLLGDPSSTRVNDICRRAVFLLEDAQGTAHPVRSKVQVQGLLALAEGESLASAPQPGPHGAKEALRVFLDRIHPEINGDPLSAENPDPSRPSRGLTLTTVAAARGLEWPVVWAVGASDRILPGDVPATDQRRMRAAQHLFYVWSTRARDVLLYCHATRSGPERDARPTRFLEPVGDLITHEVVPPPNPRR
jgi:DNA helicase-2/ATP-dependent DNA helicase PcrA